jgi:hypothetical protein
MLSFVSGNSVGPQGGTRHDRGSHWGSSTTLRRCKSTHKRVIEVCKPFETGLQRGNPQPMVRVGQHWAISMFVFISWKRKITRFSRLPGLTSARLDVRLPCVLCSSTSKPPGDALFQADETQSTST